MLITLNLKPCKPASLQASAIELGMRNPEFSVEQGFRFVAIGVQGLEFTLNRESWCFKFPVRD